MTTIEQLQKAIRIDKEILNSDIASPFKIAFIEGRLEGLELALNIVKQTLGQSSKVSNY